MREVKHTPLPWAIPVANVFRVVSPRPSSGGCWIAVADLDTDSVGGPVAHANAELIVRAVNSHGLLVKALEAAYQFYMGKQACGNFTCGCNDPEHCGICEIRKATEAALAAAGRSNG